MPYDPDLANRLRAILHDEPGLDERRMFGSIIFMINGNMACGVSGDDLIVRTGPDRRAGALAEPGCREFDLSGRSMNNWVLVSSAVLGEDEELLRWSRAGVEYAGSLLPK
ncbi:MAG: TfoX/Sxy family protein [Thermomicrobiales bacterium]|nr:TfoX/Sxy family protein [Thermomicrobiales bacterium]